MPNKHNPKKATKSSPEPPSSSRKPKYDKLDSETEPATNPPASQYPLGSLFFFKEDEENGHFCQWYECTFTDPDLGMTFNCAEQYMMYRKAILFNDTAIAATIMKTTSPRKQKSLAREITNWDDDIWNAHRIAAVERGNYLKFTQCTNAASFKVDDGGEPVPLKDLLLATQGKELVEASPFDRTWGIGWSVSEAPRMARARWGINLLGKALMAVRDRLVEEEEQRKMGDGRVEVEG